jgi:hypothetical protein
MSVQSLREGAAAPVTRELGVLDILSLYGFDAAGRSRLVRHQDPRSPIDGLVRRGWFELYQSYQRGGLFDGLESVVSFCGLSGTRAEFHGVYRVLGQRPARDGVTLPGCSDSFVWQSEAEVFYDLERDPRFDSLRGRLVIDWGGGTRRWVQKLSNKPVLEIREAGRQLPPFDDYLEFTLTYPQLTNLYAHEDAHREWRARLSAVAGIYLILAETTGEHYVGSAYGEAGIWGRWQEYARTGHGGNLHLRRLMDRDPAYPTAFRFSILQILPRTMVRKEIIDRERLYKEKLGTRATGLNLN